MARTTRRSARRPSKGIRLQFSFMSLVFWCCGLFFLLGWIFVLGILVGRGLLPESGRNLAELKGQLARLQHLVRDRRQELEHRKNRAEDPVFQFPRVLTSPGPTPGPVKAATPRPPRPTPATESEPPGEPAAYTVQLASLENGLQALKMVSQLVDRGYPAYFTAFTSNGKTRYRVRCGRFAGVEAAKEMTDRLAREDKLAGFVTRYER